TIWAAGAAAILTWLAGCGGCLGGLRRKAHTVRDPAALALVQQVCESRGVRAPLLLASVGARSPFITGFRRAAIIFPSDAEFDAATLRAVLSHEVAHVARGDLGWALFARVACAIAWPQPLAWILLRQLDQASEEACDEEVLLHDCAPRAYARCLVTLAERFLASGPERALGTGVAPRGSSLARRIRRVLETTPLGAYAARGLRLPIVSAAGLGVAGSLLLVSASAPGARPQDVQAAPGDNPDLLGRVLHASGTPAAGIRIYAVRTTGEAEP